MPHAALLPPHSILRAEEAQLDRGRAKRLRAMVEQHWALVGRMLRNFGVADADLDDAVQQVFLVASSKLDAIRAGSERAFLVQTAVHIGSRARRSRGRNREDLDEPGSDYVDSAPTAEEQLDHRRALHRLDQVLEQMSFELRTVFVLYEIEEMTMAEIAGVLEIPAGTVASRLRRARQEFHERARGPFGLGETDV